MNDLFIIPDNVMRLARNVSKEAITCRDLSLQERLSVDMLKQIISKIDLFEERVKKFHEALLDVFKKPSIRQCINELSVSLGRKIIRKIVNDYKDLVFATVLSFSIINYNLLVHLVISRYHNSCRYPEGSIPNSLYELIPSISKIIRELQILVNKSFKLTI